MRSQRQAAGAAENAVEDPEELAKLRAQHMMDAEAERQKKMQDRMRSQKEEAKAISERRIEELRRQEREEEERKRGEGEAEAQAEKRRVAYAQSERDEQSKRREREQTIRRLERNGDRGYGTLEIRPRHTSSNEKQPTETVRALDRFEDSPQPMKIGRSEAPPMRRLGSKELLGFFKRKKGDTVLQHGSLMGDGLANGERLSPAPKQSCNTGPGPGVDAPVSAVNAGERVSEADVQIDLARQRLTSSQQVIVEAGRSSIALPVTPTTTPIDLIRSVSTCLSERINANASVLLESFGKVGIQRPLRKYEHVRDVLNSWDADRQNTLILVDSATGGRDPDLEVTSVPTLQPEECSCQLYYSRKPSKWDKRYVTLRADGQIVVAKKSNAKEKDQTNLCRLTDFDIYSLAPKRSRVPRYKKHTFVVKSQQKSAMFESIEDYVHCFSTHDKRVAAAWYQAVQGWRSWYLVNVLGEGQKKASADAANAGHARSGSGTSHYQLGSFKPLLDPGSFGTPAQPNSSAPPQLSHSHSKSPSRDARPNGPPSAFTRYSGSASPDRPTTRARRSSISSIHDLDANDDSTFAPTGLLGRTYSQRQKATADPSAKASGPFTNNGLVDNAYSARPSARPSIDQVRPNLNHLPTPEEQAGLKRSASAARRDKPKPLVDLTPTYQPPPQFATAKKGKGYYPERQELGPGGMLIDAATSPELPEINRVPPASDWRARARGDEGDGGVTGGSLLARANSRRRPGTAVGKGAG